MAQTITAQGITTTFTANTGATPGVPATGSMYMGIGLVAPAAAPASNGSALSGTPAASYTTWFQLSSNKTPNGTTSNATDSQIHFVAYDAGSAPLVNPRQSAVQIGANYNNHTSTTAQLHQMSGWQFSAGNNPLGLGGPLNSWTTWAMKSGSDQRGLLGLGAGSNGASGGYPASSTLSVFGAPTTTAYAGHFSSGVSPTQTTAYLVGFAIGSGFASAGSINATSPTTVSYGTSSDHRLKEQVTPIENGLSLIEQLKPRVWKWKEKPDSPGMGFVAHEIEEAFVENGSDAQKIGAVFGEKDAYFAEGVYVDSDGNPEYDPDGHEITYYNQSEDQKNSKLVQGRTWQETGGRIPKYQTIDTSFLVAPLVAAVKELKAIVDEQQTEIVNLRTRVSALESR